MNWIYEMEAMNDQRCVKKGGIWKDLCFNNKMAVREIVSDAKRPYMPHKFTFIRIKR